jgi:ATP-dependent DNA helicase RecG
LDIIKIIVASGSEKPYFFKKYGMTEKGAFIRIGTAAEPMPQKMIDALFAKRTRNSIGKIKSNQQQLSFAQLKIYYDAVGKGLNDKFATNLELLNADKYYNYVAYLISDKNNTSIKLAKYKGVNRVNLIENNEYGYESLIKATKQVFDKMDLENKTITQITAKERKESRYWDAIALREAIINAFVHNDYTTEVPPKFELFDDRIEITSTGGLPDGLSQEEFFEGFSVPRNKEIMRIYKDLHFVEQLGSGIPRILESYPKESFKFSDNFLRMSFPINSQVTIDVIEGGPIGGPIGSPIVGLSQRQNEVLNLLKENNRLTKRDLAKLLEINVSAAQRHIEILRNRGYLTRIGGTRGHWQIIR